MDVLILHRARGSQKPGWEEAGRIPGWTYLQGDAGYIQTGGAHLLGEKWAYLGPFGRQKESTVRKRYQLEAKKD